MTAPEKSRHSSSGTTDKAAVDRADQDAGNDNQAGVQGTRDDLAQQHAAAHDDSKTVAREKDTSRTAALRK